VCTEICSLVPRARIHFCLLLAATITRPNVVVKCFVHRKSRVQISAQRPANLAEVFSWISSVSPGTCQDSTLKLGHDRFFPHPFQFIAHLSPFHSTLYSLSYRQSVVKQQINKDHSSRSWMNSVAPSLEENLKPDASF
jgi:hypothetical protein